MIKKRQPWKWESMKRKKAVIGVVTAAAIAAVVWGVGGDDQKEMAAATSTMEMTGVVQEELPVSETEEVLLSTLYETMVKSSYAETARLLNENEEAFTKLLSETLEGEKYCYRETEYEDGTLIRSLKPLGKSEVTEAMVLTRYNTVFFGAFEDGRPEGECHAIQAMVLDEPRYTFAEGMWKKGKMNGEGRTGYHYYLNAPASGFVMTDKVGTYSDNLLNGSFVYRTESVLGEKLSWEMEADMGVTVLDEDWTHFPFRKEYMLGAKEDPARAYVLTEEKSGALIWNNLITWDE